MYRGVRVELHVLCVSSVCGACDVGSGLCVCRSPSYAPCALPFAVCGVRCLLFSVVCSVSRVWCLVFVRRPCRVFNVVFCVFSAICCVMYVVRCVLFLACCFCRLIVSSFGVHRLICVMCCGYSVRCYCSVCDVCCRVCVVPRVLTHCVFLYFANRVLFVSRRCRVCVVCSCVAVCVCVCILCCVLCVPVGVVCGEMSAVGCVCAWRYAVVCLVCCVC